MEVVSILMAVGTALFSFVSRSLVESLVAQRGLLRNRNDLQIVTATGKKINILASDLTHEKVQEIVSSSRFVAHA